MALQMRNWGVIFPIKWGYNLNYNWFSGAHFGAETLRIPWIRKRKLQSINWWMGGSWTHLVICKKNKNMSVSQVNAKNQPRAVSWLFLRLNQQEECLTKLCLRWCQLYPESWSPCWRDSCNSSTWCISIYTWFGFVTSRKFPRIPMNNINPS